ncbi:MAG: redoxin domain-containing protein [Actinobacteria bacterium]|nr:redoxin domain-containing protein [Actinomycetota bacterium]
MRDDLTPGNRFPDFALPDHTGAERSRADVAEGYPLILCFVRGWWCPKEQVRLTTLVAMQEELQREYGRIAVVTVDPPYTNGAFRAGLGASFPFLSDEGRSLAEELDLIELTDAKHRPYLPLTFVLDSTGRIQRSWCGFWFAGNPTPDELRLALREITRAEQPSFDPQAVWAAGGAAAPGAGIDAPLVWIREDEAGRELQRGAHEGDPPDVGAEISRSTLDGRPWTVERLEREDGRVGVHLQKAGEPSANPLPQHHISAPAPTKTR